MEIVCTRCDGLGEERRPLVPGQSYVFEEMSRRHLEAYLMQNVAGWDMHYLHGYMCRKCEVCNGEGFRPSGPFVPQISREVTCR